MFGLLFEMKKYHKLMENNNILNDLYEESCKDIKNKLK